MGKQIVNIPTLPKELTTELLLSKCPITADGRRLCDTHVLTLVANKLEKNQVTLQNAPSLLGIEMELGTQKTPWYANQEFINKTTEPHWVLMPKVFVPHTPKMPDNYRLATAYETFITLSLSIKAETPLRIFGENKYGYTSDTTLPKKDFVAVGSQGERNSQLININHISQELLGSRIFSHYGMALARKF